ncbi:MAG: bifunctional UDP-N-acetylglucosamine diphosphorylase/glucosamine-1-phosphate N-acetyltransferase GlmU [Pseudohongiellaceae bacterium]
MPLDVVILAAGKGTRMRSALPKVLQPLGGKPMLCHVTDTAAQLKAARVHVVVGDGAERVQALYAEQGGDAKAVNWVVQAEQLGTGHAVQQALPHLAGGGESKSKSKSKGKEDVTLVLYGDVPLMALETLADMVRLAEAGSMALLTVLTDSPAGLGRILRDGGSDKDTITGIVEDKDASPAQKKINEINAGPMAIPTARLKGWLDKLDNKNAQSEYILTHTVALAVAEGYPVTATVVEDGPELLGVNDKQQLARLERFYQNRKAEQLMQAGVTLRDPARLDVRGTLTCGQEVEIDVNVLCEGEVRLGNRVFVAAGAVLKNCTVADDAVIGANAIVKDSTLSEGAQILEGSQLDGAEVGRNARVGPMARIRPGTVLAEDVRIGNFVETKNAKIGKGSKANHLTYIGDAIIGEGCNIGAGVVFCNFDGASKHRTTLGNNVFVGSNSVLVAPLTLANNSFIAAGSSITEAVPTDNLAVARGKQRNITGWQRPGDSKCAE